MSVPNKNICIIGGGPSGLSALRRVLASERLVGTLFEQNDDVGGLWNYTGNKLPQSASEDILKTSELSELDPAFVNTMYDDLSGNLPYPLMALEDFPHTKVKRTFPTQKEMHTYFQDYATHFNLWSNIQLNTTVVNVRPETPTAKHGDHNGRWIVKTRNQNDDIIKTNIFDSVIICTGTQTYPCEPKLPGLENFNGKVMHSKYFKNADAEEFQGKHVVCIGFGPSSGDLGVYISKTAKSVTICHKFPRGFKLGIHLSNVRETKNVKKVTTDEVITVEDECIKCDTIVFCTGYGFKYPFLDEECGLVVKENGKYVPHLYEMMIFTKRPTMAIFNIINRAPGISIVDVQVKFYIAYLEGKIVLPSYQQMEAEIEVAEKLKKEKGIQYSEWYQNGIFGFDYWDYYARLVEKLGLEDQYKHHSMHVHLWRIVLKRIFGKYSIFRNDKLKIVNDCEWEYILSADPNESGSAAKKIVMRLDRENGKFTANIVDL